MDADLGTYVLTPDMLEYGLISCCITRYGEDGVPLANAFVIGIAGDTTTLSYIAMSLNISQGGSASGKVTSDTMAYLMKLEFSYCRLMSPNKSFGHWDIFLPWSSSHRSGCCQAILNHILILSYRTVFTNLIPRRT